jgi:hypothetical protein
MNIPMVMAPAQPNHSLIVDSAESLHFWRKSVHKILFRSIGRFSRVLVLSFFLDFSIEVEISQIP